MVGNAAWWLRIFNGSQWPIFRRFTADPGRRSATMNGRQGGILRAGRLPGVVQYLWVQRLYLG